MLICYLYIWAVQALVSAKPDHLPLLVLNLKRAVSGKNVRSHYTFHGVARHDTHHNTHSTRDDTPHETTPHARTHTGF